MSEICIQCGYVHECYVEEMYDGDQRCIHTLLDRDGVNSSRLRRQSRETERLITDLANEKTRGALLEARIVELEAKVETHTA